MAKTHKVKRYWCVIATRVSAVDQRRFEVLRQRRGLTAQALLRELVQQPTGAAETAQAPEPEVTG